jgi:hypothetical protein
MRAIGASIIPAVMMSGSAIIAIAPSSQPADAGAAGA